MIFFWNNNINYSTLICWTCMPITIIGFHGANIVLDNILEWDNAIVYKK
jgi:hypothetical protein